MLFLILDHFFFFLGKFDLSVKPLFEVDPSQYWLFMCFLFITIVGISASVFLNKIKKERMRLKKFLHFTPGNFYILAGQSGLSRENAKFLYKEINKLQQSNKMSIFLNYSEMLSMIYEIYCQTKSVDPLYKSDIHNSLSHIVDITDILEGYFQLASEVLHTVLIPRGIQVFLSDLQNSNRISMSVHQVSMRHLVLRYECRDDNNDACLVKNGRSVTLWLLDKERGFAAYNSNIKKINCLSKRCKEYYISHSWRQDINRYNIVRKYKRAEYKEGCIIKLISNQDSQRQEVRGMLLDVSLGGCRSAIQIKSPVLLKKGQEVEIEFANPLLSMMQIAIHNYKKNQFQIQGRLTQWTVLSEVEGVSFMSIHLKFQNLDRHIKNCLGIFIYQFEQERLKRSLVHSTSK